MPVDTSFYPTQQVAPFNPLQAVGQYASAAHTLQENQMQQRQLRGQAALGQAIKSSTDPNTGMLDQNELMRQVSQNPDASMYALQTQNEARTANPLTDFQTTNAQGQPITAQAPESNVRAIGNPGQQAKPAFNSQAEVDKAHAHLSALQGIVNPLAQNPNPTEKDVSSAVIDSVAHPGVDFNSADGASLLSQLPSGPNGEPLPSEKLKPLIQQKAQQINQTKAILDAKYPSSEQIAARNQAAQFAQSSKGDDTSQQPAPTNPLELAPGVVGSATGTPAGYSENQSARQKHFLDVQAATNSVPQENAALHNILNISKIKGVPSGTMVGQMYEALASTGLAPAGVEDTGAQLKIIQNHAAQIATSGGMPGSDARLQAIENAKVGDKDLPEVIQTMVPYLLAVNQSKLEQAKYYQKKAPNGVNPDQVGSAQSDWTQNVDPRLFEMKGLMSDPAALNKYVKSLSKQDKTELLRKYNASKQLGIIQ